MYWVRVIKHRTVHNVSFVQNLICRKCDCFSYRNMETIKPLTLVARHDDLVRCRNTLTAGIESGTFSHY